MGFIRKWWISFSPQASRSLTKIFVQKSDSGRCQSDFCEAQNDFARQCDNNFWRASHSGFTVVELILALAMLGVLLAIGGRLYINSLQKFGHRMSDSEGFQKLYVLELEIEKILQSPVTDCRGGVLKVLDSTRKKTDVARVLKEKYSGLQRLSFNCLETHPVTHKLKSWRERHQPQLIEYEGVLQQGRRDVPFLGTVLY